MAWLKLQFIRGHNYDGTIKKYIYLSNSKRPVNVILNNIALCLSSNQFKYFQFMKKRVILKAQYSSRLFLLNNINLKSFNTHFYDSLFLPLVFNFHSNIKFESNLYYERTFQINIKVWTGRCIMSRLLSTLCFSSLTFINSFFFFLPPRSFVW
jgi:hypothetical protein